MARKNRLLPAAPFAFAALLAGGAASLHMTDVRVSAEPGTQAPSSDKPRGGNGSDRERPHVIGALELLADHFGLEAAGKRALRLKDVRDAASGNGVTVRFLVATVPDPIDSFAGWQFDPIVDAIQQAATESHFSLDRFAIPDLDAPADADDRTTAKRRLHEQQPGVILFRDTGDSYYTPSRTLRKELLVVFLVAETATFGVHQGAFREAVRFAAQWEPNNEISVLGPTFSGSSASIATALKNLSTHELKGRRVRIISGSATRSGRAGDGSRTRGNKEILEESIPDHVEFRATVQPDFVTFWEAYNYVLRMDPRHENHVAVLAETNTDYGHQIESFGSLIKRLPFPMHISRLAADSAANRATSASAAAAPQRFRSLSLAGLVNPTDRLPAPSFKTTASYLELALANILDTIRREHMTAVGIMATDSRDKLFLAQQVATNCPDVLIFTTESDLLFAHPEYAGYMSRAIVASTYPLYNGNQLWTPPFSGSHQRLQFPTSASQGIYNAALALIEYDYEPNDKTVKPRTLNPPSLLKYGPPGNTCAPCWPAVWLSVVSRGTIWPTKVVTTDADDYLFQTGGRPPVEGEGQGDELEAEAQPAPVRTFPSSGAKLLFIVLTSIVVLHLSVCLTIGLLRKEPAANRFVKWTHRFQGQSGPSHRRYLLACVFGLTLAYGFLAKLISTWVTTDSTVPPGIQLMATAVLAGLAVTVVWLLWTGLIAPLGNLRTRPGTQDNREASADGWRASLNRAIRGFLPRIPSTAIGLVAVGLCGWGSWNLVVYVMAPMDATDGLLLVERATDLTNRVSPIVPVLLLAAAVYLWGAVELVRLSHPRPALTDGGSDLMSIVHRCTRGGVADLTKHLRSLDGSILRLPAEGVPVIAIAGVLVVTFAFDPIVDTLITIEGVAFNRFATSFVLLVHFTIALALIQFVYRWRLLRVILERLSWHPMAAAYDRVPRTLLPKSLFPRQPRLVELETPIAQYRTLVAAGCAPLGRGDESIDELSFDFQTDLEERRSLLESRTWHSLTVAAQSVAGELDTTWRHAGPDRRSAPAKREATAEGESASTTRAAVAHAEAVTLADRERKIREEFVAMPIVFAIRDALSRLGQNVLFIMGAILLVLATHLLYPFQSQQRLMAFVWADILLAVAALLLVIVQAERNPIMSRLTSTTPGQIAWDSGFVSKLIVYGLLPLLALFAAQFPEIGSTLLQWIEPVQKAIP